MSDHKMSVERADGLLNKGWASTDIRHDYVAALHAVAHQAEQIETLSRLLAEAEAAAIERAEQIERLQAALRAADGLVLAFSGLPPRTDFESGYNLHPGDMEPSA